MSPTQFTNIADMQKYLDEIVDESCGEFEVNKITQMPWGVEVDVSMGQAARDTSELFTGGDVVLSTQLGVDSDYSDNELLVIDLEMEDGTALKIVGNVSSPKYCDDEHDCYFSGSVLIANPGGESALQTRSIAIYDEKIMAEISTAAQSLTTMIGTLVDKTGSSLPTNAKIMDLLRIIASSS